jgi:hypothetical protein
LHRAGIFIAKHPDGRRDKLRRHMQASWLDGPARRGGDWTLLEHQAQSPRPTS